MAWGIRVGVVVAAAVGIVGLTVGFATGQAKGDPKAGEADVQGEVRRPARRRRRRGRSGREGAEPESARLDEGRGTRPHRPAALDSIKKGGEAVGRGKTMPASPTLSDAEVWNLVAYIKTLKKA